MTFNFMTKQRKQTSSFVCVSAGSRRQVHVWIHFHLISKHVRKQDSFFLNELSLTGPEHSQWRTWTDETDRQSDRQRQTHTQTDRVFVRSRVFSVSSLTVPTWTFWTLNISCRLQRRQMCPSVEGRSAGRRKLRVSVPSGVPSLFGTVPVWPFCCSCEGRQKRTNKSDQLR